jgi:Ran GTPase-activating protein (RanGAP) involved in mRNA processing and transport
MNKFIKIIITKSGLCDKSIEFLAPMLAQQQSLEVLDFSDNNISNNGAIMISNVIR